MTEMEQIDAVPLSAEEEARIDVAIANAQDPGTTPSRSQLATTQAATSSFSS